MTPLVLLHAFPFDSMMFDSQIEPLAATQLVRPDFPGFGNEPLIPGMTVDALAEYVVSILDRNGLDRAAIGGVSMGGYVAMAVARNCPDRVSGLILADTRAEPDDDAAKANRAKAIEAVRKNGIPAFVDTLLAKVLGATTRRDYPAKVEWIRKVGYRQKPDGAIAALEMLRDRPDARPGLAEVTCPTLIVVGEEDEITPLEAAESMKALVPHATLAIIPNAGHLANYERPDEFNAAVLTFLSKSKLLSGV